jgi:hypothetical protein
MATETLAHAGMAEEVRVSRRRLTDSSVMRGPHRKDAYVSQFGRRLENGPRLHTTNRLQAAVGASLTREEQRYLLT